MVRAIGREGLRKEVWCKFLVTKVCKFVLCPLVLYQKSFPPHTGPAGRWDLGGAQARGPRPGLPSREEQRSRKPWRAAVHSWRPHTPHVTRNQFQAYSQLLLLSPTLWVFKPHPLVYPHERQNSLVHPLTKYFPSTDFRPAQCRGSAVAKKLSSPSPSHFSLGMAISQRTVRSD